MTALAEEEAALLRERIEELSAKVKELLIPPDPLGLRARLAPRPDWVRPSLAWILSLDEDAWRAATRKTALRRSKYRGLLRNALVAAGNAGEARLRPAVARLAESDDPLLAEHARWVLARIDARAL